MSPGLRVQKSTGPQARSPKFGGGALDFLGRAARGNRVLSFVRNKSKKNHTSIPAVLIFFLTRIPVRSVALCLFNPKLEKKNGGGGGGGSVYVGFFNFSTPRWGPVV